MVKEVQIIFETMFMDSAKVSHIDDFIRSYKTLLPFEIASISCLDERRMFIEK